MSQRKGRHYARRMIETDYYYGENTNIAARGEFALDDLPGETSTNAILSGLQGLPTSCITFNHSTHWRLNVFHTRLSFNRFVFKRSLSYASKSVEKFFQFPTDQISYTSQPT